MQNQSNSSETTEKNQTSSLCKKSKIPIQLRNRNDYTTTTYLPTNYKKPSKNGHAVSEPRTTGPTRLAEHTPFLWQLSTGLFSLLYPGIRPAHVERSSTGRHTMTIQVTVTVSSGNRASDTTLRQLISEIERIKSYDGTTIRVNVEHMGISLFPGSQPLHEVIERMLAEADAATSPHYTAPPRGMPFSLRVQAAMRVFESASPDFRREAERRAKGAPARNRQEHMRQNPEIFQHFYRSRGLETEFLRFIVCKE